MTDLIHRTCIDAVERLSDAGVSELLSQVPNWARDGVKISRTFEFKNYFETIAFVNALAWIAHAEDHHPDLTVGYKTCVVVYSTHSVSGLSENDFICAAKMDALVFGK